MIDEVSVDVDSVLQRLNVLSSGTCVYLAWTCAMYKSQFHFPYVQTGINGTSDILSRVSNTTQELQSQSDALNTSLNNVAADIEALRTACGGTVTECNNIPPGSTFTPEADFNQVSCRECVYNVYVLSILQHKVVLLPTE